MKGKDLLDKMELIDPAYIEAADRKPQNKRGVGLKFGAIAACLCFLISTVAAICAIVAHQSNIYDIVDNYNVTMAAGFYLDGEGTLYFPVSFEQRKKYGLVSEDAVGLNKENTYRITEADIGEQIGVVAGCADETLNGCKVYSFTKYSEDNSICIVDTPKGYAFYTCSYAVKVENEIGASFDVFLSAYDLPRSMKNMQIMTADLRHLTDIDDEAVIEAVFEILSGKINFGMQEHERRCAKLWYDTYGNDDVFYNEEAGVCGYRDSSTELRDKAQALLTKNERVIFITTTDGYQLMIDYFPTLCTFNCGDGFYEISPDEAKTLNLLLDIGK